MIVRYSTRYSSQDKEQLALESLSRKGFVLELLCLVFVSGVKIFVFGAGEGRASPIEINFLLLEADGTEESMSRKGLLFTTRRHMFYVSVGRSFMTCLKS